MLNLFKKKKIKNKRTKKLPVIPLGGQHATETIQDPSDIKFALGRIIESQQLQSQALSFLVDFCKRNDPHAGRQ